MLPCFDFAISLSGFSAFNMCLKQITFLLCVFLFVHYCPVSSRAQNPCPDLPKGNASFAVLFVFPGPLEMHLLSHLSFDAFIFGPTGHHLKISCSLLFHQSSLIPRQQINTSVAQLLYQASLDFQDLSWMQHSHNTFVNSFANFVCLGSDWRCMQKKIFKAQNGKKSYVSSQLNHIRTLFVGDYTTLWMSDVLRLSIETGRL